MNRLLSFLISLAFFGVVGFFAFAKGAQAAQFYLSPASGAVQINNNITLDIRLNTQGITTAIAEMHLSYDQSKLEFQSYSNSSSPLTTAIGLSAGSGSVSVTQYIPGSGENPPTPTQGDILFGKVTFKALVESGSTDVNFLTGSNQSMLWSFEDTDGLPVGNPGGGDPQPTTGVGGTYTFTAPVSSTDPPVVTNPPSSTKPPSSPTSGSKTTTATTTNSEGAETTNVPNTVGDTAVPEITNIRVSNITDTSVVVEWDTNEPATSYVVYGETSSYGKGQGDASYTKEHKLMIKEGLSATTKYNFQVFSSDQAGNTAYSKNQTFTTKPPVSVQRTYRFIGLAMIIGGLAALGIIAFYYFRKKGPHPDNLTPDGPAANLNPPI